MAQVEKRWSVTYTKHLKQKRKVYRDGILHLLSNHKVMLYDESEQLLESRFLAKGEVVKSGESLPFDCFLVDIGHPKSQYDDAAKQNTRLQQSGDKLTPAHRSKKGKLSIPPTKTTATAINISPSRQIIREFKKNQQVKYQVQQVRSPQTATNSSFPEWEALYTAQITQKAKKYHDGVVRLITCGSQGRQIILYDASKNQLDKRFLKKDEVISSGESLAFDAYLVDIGDRIRTKEDDTDGRNCKIIEKIDTTVGHQSHNSFADNLVSNAQKIRVSAQQEQYRACESASKENPQHRGCSSKQVNSNLCSLGVEKMKLGQRLPSHMQFRDAHQILSILRKPGATEGTLIGEEATSELVQLDCKCHNIQGFIPSDQLASGTVVEKCKDNGPLTSTLTKGNGPQSETVHDDLAASTGSHNCDKERPVSTQGIQTIESSASVGSALIDRLQASVHRETRIILDFSEDFSAVKTEDGTHTQCQPELPQADPKTQAPACSTLDTCMGLNAKILNGSFDYPNFDLGI